MRGRKPTPTPLKLLRGNPGRRQLNENEPKPEATLPAVPASLVTEAQTKCTQSPACGRCARCRSAWTATEAIAEWNRRALDLFTLGVLTDWDTSAFEAYCRAWARYLNAEAKVAEQGEVVLSRNHHPMQNPYRSVANRALAQCQQFWSEFGMMPSSRSRIGAGAKPGAGKSDAAAKRRARFFPDHAKHA